MKSCPLGLCDGSGMRDTYTLHTVKRGNNGSTYIDKQPLTRQQAQDLTPKIDWKDQKIFEGAKMCDCRAKATA